MNRNEKIFIWGKYDYSNNINENEDNKNLKEENKSIIAPLKEKIKEGISEIYQSELNNKIKNKNNLKSKKENINYNKSGIINYIQNNNQIYEDNDYQITCKIDEYKDRVVGKDHIIFYKIELFSSLSSKKWNI